MGSAAFGDFVWFDLITSDPTAAMAFYTEVMGWKTQPFGDDYTMFLTAQGPLGGLTSLTPALRAQGIPPFWSSYVQVGDADAVVAEVRRLGGRIWREPTAYPEIGRLAVIGDPQGAVINLIQAPAPMPAHDPDGAGELTWSELVTTDQQAGFAFYSQLFGWRKSRDFDMGPMGIYTLFNNGGRDLGGMFTKPADRPGPPGWLYYVETAELDAAVARAQARGGQLLNGPMEVPGGARVAQLADPQGAMFALHERAHAR